MFAEIGEVLIASTFAVVVYQDFKGRWVDDRAWIVGMIGVVILVAAARGSTLWLLVTRILVLAALAWLWRAMGMMGAADVMALPLLGASTSLLSPLPELIVSVLATFAIMAIVKFERGGLTVKLSVGEARGQSFWVPKRIVKRGSGDVVEELKGSPEEVWRKLDGYVGREDLEVEASYGLPFAAIMGLGYIAARLIDLLIQIW